MYVCVCVFAHARSTHARARELDADAQEEPRAYGCVRGVTYVSAWSWPFQGPARPPSLQYQPVRASAGRCRADLERCRGLHGRRGGCSVGRVVGCAAPSVLAVVSLRADVDGMAAAQMPISRWPDSERMRECVGE